MNLAVLAAVAAGTVAAVAGVVYVLFRAFESRLFEKQSHEQTKSRADLDQSKQAFEFKVESLNKEISRLTALVTDFDKDRRTAFGTLEERLAQSIQVTQGLSQSTNKLNSILGNNQQRGMLGQRAADEILAKAGLEEGLHYVKDRAQDTINTRPDYTFYLPENHKCHMDVKFPFSNYNALMETQDRDSQARLTQEFIRDVKGHMRDLRKRNYINPDERTLDFVVMFIPSEEVFCFILKAAPGIMDEALEQKILLVSPFSLYSVLSIIRQAHENFSFKQRVGDLLAQINLFFGDLELHKKRFESLGAVLDKSRELYGEIKDTSFKRLEQRSRKLEEFRNGKEGPQPVIVEMTPQKEVAG